MRRRFLVVAAVVATGVIMGAGVAQASGLQGRVEVGGPNRAVHSRTLQVSSNWSGWADTTPTGKFTYVHSRWKQPAVTCNGTRNNWASAWVGLDGWANFTVEQDGTDAWCGGKDHKTPHYAAWYEMYPAPSFDVFKINPGDTIDAVVQFKSGKFYVTIADLTRGKSFTKAATCGDCERASAEWIVERPAFCSDNSCDKGYLTALANFHSVTMTQNTVGVSGQGISPMRRYTSPSGLSCPVTRVVTGPPVSGAALIVPSPELVQ